MFLVFLHHIRVLQVRWYQNRTTAIEKQNQSSHKVTRKQPIVNLFSFFKNCQRTKFSTDLLHYIRVLYVQWHHNCLTGIWGTKPKVVPKWPKSRFWTVSNFSKSVLTIQKKFPIVILHHFRVLYRQWQQNCMAAIKKPSQALRWPGNSQL